MRKALVVTMVKAGLSLLGGVQLPSLMDGEVRSRRSKSRKNLNTALLGQGSAPRREGKDQGVGCCTKSIFPSLLRPVTAEQAVTLAWHTLLMLQPLWDTGAVGKTAMMNTPSPLKSGSHKVLKYLQATRGPDSARPA